MASVVSHSVILITSLSRVILIHYEWHLDMPSLTDVYLPYAFHYKKDVTIRGSTLFISLSRIDIGALQRFFNWSPRGGWILFVPHISFITVWEPIISVQVLTQWPFQSQVKSIIQNRWNSRSSSFSKTIWNRYISHSIITCIPFCHNRKRYVFSPFTLISVSMLVWITSQMAFKRDCGYNQFRWISWLLQFCHRSSLIRYWVSFKHCEFHFVANQWFILSGTKQVWWIDSDRYGKRLYIHLSLFVSCCGVHSGCRWQLNFFYEEIESLSHVAFLEAVG